MVLRTNLVVPRTRACYRVVPIYDVLPGVFRRVNRLSAVAGAGIVPSCVAVNNEATRAPSSSFDRGCGGKKSTI